jgi:hypothetical protein
VRYATASNSPMGAAHRHHQTHCCTARVKCQYQKSRPDEFYLSGLGMGMSDYDMAVWITLLVWTTERIHFE